MNLPSTGALRTLRSTVVTVVVVALATVAHVTGGGHVPTGPAAVAVVVAVACVTHQSTRWRLGLPGVSALLTGGQLLLHETFAALEPARGVSLDVHGAAAAGGGAHRHVTGLPTSDDALVPAALTSGGTTSGGTGLVHGLGAAGIEVGAWTLTPMVAGHVAATVVTALVLAGGERALWRLWSWLAPLVAVLLTPSHPVAVRLPRARRGSFGRRGVRDVVLARSLRRRGPPAVPARA